MKRKHHATKLPKNGHVKLKSLNSLITCKLCKGYLVEAATITECLHTFCKSCIVKYLEENNDCPVCEIFIHHSHPLNYVSLDRTLQDIVYKLVPNLAGKEKQREEIFYKKRGLRPPVKEDDRRNGVIHNNHVPTSLTNGTDAHEVSNTSLHNSNCNVTSPSLRDVHAKDAKVQLCLLSKESSLKQIQFKCLRLSEHATITHLKKFVASKVFDNISSFNQIDITCDDQIVGKDHSLKFILLTRWQKRDVPLTLHYCSKIQFY